MKDHYKILLTSDDGIRSPGLWMAAQAVSSLGSVTISAPREQYSSAGRSMPPTSDGIIQIYKPDRQIEGLVAYSIGGTPAQAIQHGVLEILGKKPDIAIAGINYGENLGVGITISGTVGAALEAASLGIKALAISLETSPLTHFSYSSDVNFSVAAYFTRYFSELLLRVEMALPDVDLLKVDIPSNAEPDTPWEVTYLSRKPYYRPVPSERKSWDEPGTVSYTQVDAVEDYEVGSDVYTLRVKRHISVTPISLDMTSRVDLTDFEKRLKQESS